MENVLVSLEKKLTEGPPPSIKEKMGKLADLLERSGINPDEIGKVERINVWQGFLKDENGEAQLVDMAGIVLSPEWAEGPQYPVVQPAAPTLVRPLKSSKTKTDTRVTVILPDPQIGYRRVGEEMIPMHDERAMSIALQIVRDMKPDAIVNLGDFIDLPEWSSKFLVLPEFVLTTQPAIDRAHRFLAEQKAVVSEDTEIVLIAGNHDDRLGKAIARNAMAAMRLKRADVPNEFPVLSIPFLLRLDDLGVKYISGYPAGRHKITNGNDIITPLYAIHGEKLDVAKVATSERQSFVQGHIHRFAMHSQTYEIDGTPKFVMAFSSGCLCRIDGAVPSTKSATDDHGTPLTRWESWQQGVAVVTENPDGYWTAEMVPIYNGTSVFRGKTYKAE
jgi:hypothetical protein